MKEVILSVIVPVYCVEKTLSRCVESILAQGLENMEVILVDDESPDNCPFMCDEWAKRDSRIHVLHKKNGGLSDARNAGIDISTGQYITFVDSDDYIEHHTYQTLTDILSAHQEYDIIEFPVNQFEYSTKEQLLTFDDKVYTNIKEYWFSTSAYRHTYAWNKIYKRKLFNNIRFPVGKVFEDVYTYPLLLGVTQQIATSSFGMYHYCMNDKGITASAGGKSWSMLLDAHLQILSNPIFQPATEDYLEHLLNIQLYTNELTGESPKMPFTHFHHIKTIKTILNNTIGINNLCKLNRLFRRLIKRHQ